MLSIISDTILPIPENRETVDLESGIRYFLGLELGLEFDCQINQVLDWVLIFRY